MPLVRGRLTCRLCLPSACLRLLCLPGAGAQPYDQANEREGDVPFEEQLRGLERVVKAGKVRPAAGCRCAGASGTCARDVAGRQARSTLPTLMAAVPICPAGPLCWRVQRNVVWSDAVRAGAHVLGHGTRCMLLFCQTPGAGKQRLAPRKPLCSPDCCLPTSPSRLPAPPPPARSLAGRGAAGAAAHCFHPE